VNEPGGGALEGLVEARLAVARAEARRDEVEGQLAEAGRRVQDFAAAWRSPVRSTAWIAVRAYRAARHRLRGRRPFSWGPLVLTGLAHVRRQTCRLRDERPVEKHSTTPPGAASIRWMGRLDLDAPVEALFAHPDSHVTYRVAAPPRVSAFVARCALHPAAWGRNRTGVTFTCELRLPSTGWSAAASRTVDTSRFRDRRWKAIVVPVPAGDGDLEVTLSTAFTTDHSFAWALWGDPRFEWRRTGAERRQLVHAALERFRRGGLREVAGTLRALGEGASEATAYRRWCLAHTPGEEALAAARDRIALLAWQPLVSVVTPVFNTDPRHLRAAIESVRRQLYPRWELCLADDGSSSAGTLAVLDEASADVRVRVVRLPSTGGISEATNAAIRASCGELVAFLDHDDELAPEALASVVEHWNAAPDTDVTYSDEDKLDASGVRCDPYFKPEWSPDLFLSFMYTCHLMVVRRTLLDEAGGLRGAFDGAQDYDLLLRLSSRTSGIRHVPGVLYHWRKSDTSTAKAGAAKPWATDAGRRAIEAHLGTRGVVEATPHPGLYRVRYRIPGEPLVSIVIPTRGRTRLLASRGVDMLTNCLRSLATRTSWPHVEVVVVADDGVLSESAGRALRDLRHVLVPYDAAGPFNFSRKVNVGVGASSGAHVLLLNDDTEAREDGWLTAMLELASQPAIGAVGAKLYYPDGRLQHVGILVGVVGVAAHAYHQAPGDHPGYAGSNLVIRNVSAVTGACMLTRREVFAEVGGFDEALAVDFNDVDYCLKARRAGYRVVFTPFAELYHHESASFGDRIQSPRERRHMEDRWGDAVRVDPYYPPPFSRARPDFTLDD
jgi:GT2 family glycosyltransferase